jgi:hypothetical protein
MKIKSILIVAVVMFSLSPFIYAQCPQICDGNQNTALGQSALVNNTASENTAVGFQALQNNTEGLVNTAIGANALFHLVNGQQNTAIGVDALRTGVSSFANTATGRSALDSNNGADNTATGAYALSGNSTGKRNTATGAYALQASATASNNTAIGWHALQSNTGPGNVGVGSQAGQRLSTGNGNVCLGAFVFGNAGESNTTRIRNVYSSVASDRAVYVTADNKIGTLVSSRRFKEEIKPMDKASEAILSLKPVSFRYKKEIESNGSIMFGLIAEDVEKADPDLVTRNEKGEAETVRYDAVNAMLLNEFLKEHQTVQELKSTDAKQEAIIAQQQKQIEALTATLKEQASQIQKVSAQLEASKPAPHVVKNP